METRAKEYTERVGYDRRAKALFYLGAICQATIDEEKSRKQRSPFERKVYFDSEFESNIQNLFSEAMLKLADYGLESDLEWAVRGFVDNYTKAVEEMGRAEKKFYVISGCTFFATEGVFFTNEWLSASEATKLWGLADSTIRKAIERGSFKKGEYRKSGNVWLVREAAMSRIYGLRLKMLDKNFAHDHIIYAPELELSETPTVAEKCYPAVRFLKADPSTHKFFYILASELGEYDEVSPHNYVWGYISKNNIEKKFLDMAKVE
jgi:hypothetical protein